MANTEKCPYCQENPDVIVKGKGYAVMWPEVRKDIDRLTAMGYNKDLAVTKAINNWIVWVTGSSICKIKTRAWVIEKFWDYYAKAPKALEVRQKVEYATKELILKFQAQHPEAWKCLTGQEYQKKVSGMGHGRGKKNTDKHDGGP